jgi:hypothetical protein
MPDDGGFHRQLTDGVDVVIGDLLDPLVSKDLGVLIGLRDGLRIIGPARRKGREALLLEECAPAVLTAGEEPQAVDEYDRPKPGGVGPVDLLPFMGRESCHALLLWDRYLAGQVGCSSPGRL